jgi:hypothetical protein
VHACGELHDTAVRLLNAGLGVRWITHLVPFQRSARVDTLSGRCAPGAKIDEDPTAVHAFRELHDTPARVLDVSDAAAVAGAVAHSNTTPRTTTPGRAARPQP